MYVSLIKIVLIYQMSLIRSNIIFLSQKFLSLSRIQLIMLKKNSSSRKGSLMKSGVKTSVDPLKDEDYLALDALNKKLIKELAQLKDTHQKFIDISKQNQVQLQTKIIEAEEKNKELTDHISKQLDRIKYLQKHVAQLKQSYQRSMIRSLGKYQTNLQKSINKSLNKSTINLSSKNLVTSVVHGEKKVNEGASNKKNFLTQRNMEEKQNRDQMNLSVDLSGLQKRDQPHYSQYGDRQNACNGNCFNDHENHLLLKQFVVKLTDQIQNVVGKLKSVYNDNKCYQSYVELKEQLKNAMKNPEVKFVYKQKGEILINMLKQEVQKSIANPKSPIYDQKLALLQNKVKNIQQKKEQFEKKVLTTEGYDWKEGQVEIIEMERIHTENLRKVKEMLRKYGASEQTMIKVEESQAMLKKEYQSEINL